MSNNRRLAQLDAHQAVILEMLKRGEGLLNAPERDAGALARTRWELVRALMAYQRFKHSEIFDPVAAKGCTDEARLARRLKSDCLQMGEAFRAYVATWSSRSVLECWAEYHPAALALVARIRDHMATERRETGRLLKT